MNRNVSSYRAATEHLEENSTTHVSGIAGVLVGELDFVEGYRAFHPETARIWRVLVRETALNTGRLAFPARYPFRTCDQKPWED